MGEKRSLVRAWNSHIPAAPLRTLCWLPLRHHGSGAVRESQGIASPPLWLRQMDGLSQAVPWNLRILRQNYRASRYNPCVFASNALLHNLQMWVQSSEPADSGLSPETVSPVA